MSLRTCPLCDNKYEDYFTNWSSPYCCKQCFKTKNTRYKIDEVVYSYANRKNKDLTLSAFVCKGKIVNIYKIARPTKNGIYQFAIQFDDINRISYRFVHQIFTDADKCNTYVETINKRRAVMREANELLKEI